MLSHHLVVVIQVIFILQTYAKKNRIISNLDDLPYDENDHLASHILAYPATCSSLIEKVLPDGPNLYQHIPIAMEGEAATALFGDKMPDSTITDILQCPAVCLDRGVDKSLVAYPIPESYWNPTENNDHSTFPSFVSSLSCGRVEFGFINYSKNVVSLNWVNNEGHKQYLYPLERMEKNTRFIHTFIGHRFVAEDPNTKEELLDVTVEFTGVIGIYNHINRHQDRDIREQVRRTMGGEWSKHLQVKRTFSPLGFATGRLPNDVFGSMRSYYYNNRDPPHRLMEEWDSKGVYVNYWESDCNFIQIPWDLKAQWQVRLKDVVQEWVGVEIEQTDMYGIRQYEAGARLLTHVDRITTHAVSLIVNIAQGNLTQPWTVEVYDHADRLHEVVMTPGDIVYYESAKALHGRNRKVRVCVVLLCTVWLTPNMATSFELGLPLFDCLYNPHLLTEVPIISLLRILPVHWLADIMQTYLHITDQLVTHNGIKKKIQRILQSH